jgi:hypothetical protein
MIQFQVTETIHLRKLPGRLRREIRAKVRAILETIQAQADRVKPGMYIDKSFINAGVEQYGNDIVGFIEVRNKSGYYSFGVKNARVMFFVSSEGKPIYTTFVYKHPYFKYSSYYQALIDQQKPWIEAQLASVIERDEEL